jgi:hypothetical protein
LLRGVLSGKHIVEKIKKKADPIEEEWKRSYSETMMFEDYKILLMMKLKKEYLARVIERREFNFGKPQLKLPDKAKLIRMHGLDILECVIVCNLLQYNPTYYADAGTIYFSPQELATFAEMIDGWILQNSPQSIRRMAEGLGELTPASKADIDVVAGYCSRLQ